MRTASIVYFYFGDNSYLIRLAQETNRLELATKGYDHVTLLTFPTTIGPFKLSQKVVKAADTVLVPTRGNFINALKSVTEMGFDAVDVYIFAHGMEGSFSASTGVYGSNTSITRAYLQGMLPEPLKGIRLVYQVNCYGAQLNDTWLKLGAKVAVGTKDVNFYPSRFAPFIKGWNKGQRIKKAVRSSNKTSIRLASQLYLWSQFLVATGKAKKDITLKDYFKEAWAIPWKDTLTFGANMNAASKQVISGNLKSRKKEVG